ncbi:alpha/beta fold hydrolase [Nakamurella sp.]|uniref:alpha/beta fold hydrolase n=1 Tax=Nakamurella sp. TaxID=1869182 RepID=UPI00378498E6
MTKPTIVLLHGVGLDHTMWQPVTALLADRYRVLALDLPGHGTNPPAPAGVSLDDLADAVAPQVPAGAHLIGFSLGALIAQQLARYRPELVASLTSVNSVCRRTEPERAAVLARLAAAERDFPASVEASLHRWYDGTGVAPELVRATRDVLLANDVDSFLNCYRVFATGDARIGPELSKITVPSLALTGELDGGSTPEMSRRLAAAMPHCRAQVVPGARHMLPVQEPEAFVTSITTFLRERDNVASQSV